MGVDAGCLWGYLTQAQHTRKAFLNRKVLKMSRDETAVGSQDTDVKKRIIGREQSTQRPVRRHKTQVGWWPDPVGQWELGMERNR